MEKQKMKKSYTKSQNGNHTVIISTRELPRFVAGSVGVQGYTKEVIRAYQPETKYDKRTTVRVFELEESAGADIVWFSNSWGEPFCVYAGVIQRPDAVGAYVVDGATVKHLTWVEVLASSYPNHSDDSEEYRQFPEGASRDVDDPLMPDYGWVDILK
jgi:hypothetical protein